MRKLILKNFQCPGDIVMLTAAIRDLHRGHPKKFLTDVRTSCPELWENNPHITPIADGEAESETIECHYPLIHQSNERPLHFIHGFAEYLGERLRAPIVPRAFKGDIHLSFQERVSPSPIIPSPSNESRYWLIVAGGKMDYTIKWWSTARFQAVVDGLRGKIQFVQVGASEHFHPALDGVLDMRGKTTVRELIHWVYHADGVLCPVTFLMHLAAAIPLRPGKRSRPCVVVAGGREPPHWEAYPIHQFIHTVGSLDCCRTGGCWRSRTVPVGDGDVKDRPKNLCVDVVEGLPRCMDMITPEAVVERILYFR
jgi:ADP-heptose:LPS heptosyltransferase